MKKKKYIPLVIIIACAILSIISEIILFNFRPIFLGQDSPSISNVIFTHETIKNQTALKLDLEPTYIDKLVLSYATDKDVDYTVTYKYHGLYGAESTTTLNDVLDNSFSKAILNINQNVSEIVITINNERPLITTISTDNNFHFNPYRAMFAFFVLCVIAFLIYFYILGFTTERLHIYFAAICILLGSMFIVAQPAATYYSWDDQIHFDNVVGWFGGANHYNNGEYQLSDANVLDSPGKDSINSAEERRQQENLLNQEIEHNYTKNTTPIPSIDKIYYLPMAIGYHIAKLCHLPFIICFLLGKTFNLIIYTLLMSYAIKVALVGKRLIAILALIPTSVFIASNYSYDSLVISGVTIFTVHIINLFTNKKQKLDFKTTLILIASMATVCLTKAVYAPLFLLTLLIPKSQFSSKKHIPLIKVGFTIIAILLLCTAAFPILDKGDASDQRGGNVSATEQAALIAQHPTDYATVFKDTTLNLFFKKFMEPSAIADFAYMGPINITFNAYYIFIFLIIFVFITDNKGNSLSSAQRFAGVSATLLTIALIWGALYLTYTPIGDNTVQGVQNRYFLPILLPMLLFLQPKHITNSISSKKYNAIVLATPAIMIMFLVYFMILSPYSL